jgi:hypothetical protein
MVPFGQSSYMTDSDTSELDFVDYDPGSDTYTAEFQTDTELASTVLAEALADIRRCETVDLDPLYHTIDTDALDTLIETSGDASLVVTITIDGFDVRLVGDGRIEITPPESQTD